MAYSKTKPYNKVSYKGAADPSYDRYLKEAVNAGKAENIKESELEKPYNVKQTYGAMQQDYNFVLPPPYEWPELPGVLPGITIPVDDDDGIIPVGSGGLSCIWTNTGCEQLVGCWAGSDIVLDGPEAATAGYMPVEVLTGDIVSQTVSGSEGRGIEIIMNPTVPQNTLNVKFKDGLGVIHNQLLDITCTQPNTWSKSGTSLPCETNRKSACVTSDLVLHIFYPHSENFGMETYLGHLTWDGVSYTDEELYAYMSESSCLVDSSDHIHVISSRMTYEYVDEDIITHNELVYHTNATGSWVSTVIYDNTASDYSHEYSILIDSSGYIHVTAVFAGAAIITHTTNSSGSWATETVLSVSGTRSIASCSSLILSDNTVCIAYIQREAYPLTELDYLKYISGTWGSWSGVTDIANSSGYDNVELKLTQDGVKHIITTTTSNIQEYYYSGSWTYRAINSLSLRYPTATTRNSEIYVVASEYIPFDFYFRECIYTSSWALPEAVWLEQSGNFGPRYVTVLYDSYRDMLHCLYQDSSYNLGHAVRYL